MYIDKQIVKRGKCVRFQRQPSIGEFHVTTLQCPPVLSPGGRGRTQCTGLGIKGMTRIKLSGADIEQWHKITWFPLYKTDWTWMPRHGRLNTALERLNQDGQTSGACFMNYLPEMTPFVLGTLRRWYILTSKSLSVYVIILNKAKQ